jgi:hypothetical protein
VSLAAIENVYLVYQFIKRLVTPFDETEAFRLGLLDKNGKLIRKPKTPAERNAYGPFDRLVFNIKRLIEKLPGGKSKIASWAAALLLIREQAHAEYWNTHQEELAEAFYQSILTCPDIPEDLFEDVAVNNVGGGAVAGLGVGPQGEPPGHFGGVRKFKVKSEYYHKARFGKKKHSNYKYWVGEDAGGQEIRKYANENPGKPIIVQDQNTGAMLFLRRRSKSNVQFGS